MLTSINFPNRVKLLLMLLGLALAFVMSSNAAAKAQFSLKFCYVLPYIPPEVSGKPYMLVRNNGGSFTLNSIYGTFSNLGWQCKSGGEYDVWKAVDNNSGDYAEWNLGWGERMGFYFTTPTLTYRHFYGDVTKKCTASTSILMVVQSFVNGGFYGGTRAFWPAAGNNGTIPGNGLVKLIINWEPLGVDLTCSADLSGL